MPLIEGKVNRFWISIAWKLWKNTEALRPYRIIREKIQNSNWKNEKIDMKYED